MSPAISIIELNCLERSDPVDFMKATDEIKVNLLEMKKSLERDLVIRRYQKWMQGEILFEDRVRDYVIKVKTQFVTSWRFLVKRNLDVLMALAALIVASPIMILVALALKLDSRGTIFYSQVRVGKKGKHFNMHKFRTMVENAEAKTGPVWAKENDPRVTRVGKFLRRTHLDELPQLFNVLRGQMSIVGPRPERPYFVEEFRHMIPHYDRRLCTSPGITGLAQIKRRYDETIADVKRKLRYDILYVEKVCPLLDFKVLAMTFGAVILRTGR